MDSTDSRALTRAYASPLGMMTLAERDGRLVGAWYDGQKYDQAGLGPSRPEEPGEAPVLDEAAQWLDRYFAGEEPGEVPAISFAGTPFQISVWQELLAIPYGTTTTYGQLAERLAAKAGHAESARAVGTAVGRNPLLIFVPCHRVLGADGGLHGYAAGLERKEQLLKIEGVPLSGRGRKGRRASGAAAAEETDDEEHHRGGLPSMPDADACWRAYLAKDARFDGIFFAGVKTTGIYCRSTCPSRPPKRENIEFFPTAAAAEAAGYRPCLRCRPELAPGSEMPSGESLLVRRAARLLSSEGAHLPVSAVAEKLGVSPRHLRRLFEAHMGTTPMQYRSTARLLLAKELLSDTALPITQVAYAVGFESVRRFNDEMKRHYRMSPHELRADAGPSPSATGQGIPFRLGFRPPFAADRLLAFLKGRAIQGVEAVEGMDLRRSARLKDAEGTEHCGWIEVHVDMERRCLSCRMAPELLPCLPQAVDTVGRIFDTAAMPESIEEGLEGFYREAGSRYRVPGVRLAGASDPFEIGCRAILGQQISVPAAGTLTGRLAKAFGKPIETPFADVTLLFPRPEDILAQGPLEEGLGDQLGELGITRQKQRAIVALAQGMAEGGLELVPGADARATKEALLKLPGIGDWTAEYLLMRACSCPDAFPTTDFAVKKAFPGMSSAQIEAASGSWRPWRSYAAMALWQTES